MIIIGERINSTRPQVQKAMNARNASYIEAEASRQLKAGSEILDVNCAMGHENEVQNIDWTISVIQSMFPGIGICVDSPNYLAIEAALKTYMGKGERFINSITADQKRIDLIIPLALKYRAKVIALAMDENGMPEDVKGRVEIARKIVQRTGKAGLPEEDLFIDPLIRPVSTEPAQAKAFLDSIPRIKEIGPVRIVCGLSNISFGLPRRSIINSVFLSLAINGGIDACIMDPTDPYVMSSLFASHAILGKDDFCSQYIQTFRDGRLV